MDQFCNFKVNCIFSAKMVCHMYMSHVYGTCICHMCMRACDSSPEGFYTIKNCQKKYTIFFLFLTSKGNVFISQLVTCIYIYIYRYLKVIFVITKIRSEEL